MTTPKANPATDPNRTSNPKRALLTLLTTALVAAAVTVAFVLPAEFGLDPIGTGELLGINELSGPAPSNPVRHDGRIGGDDRTFVLDPFASVEVKYDMRQGATLIYRWQATGEVFYDLHAEGEAGGAVGEDGAVGENNEPTVVSIARGQQNTDSGAYQADFHGIHGWFFENRTAQTVTVHLAVQGFITGATLYQGNDVQSVELTEPP